MIDIREKLKEVLELEEKERNANCEIELISFYEFDKDPEFAITEKEFYGFFAQFHRELSKIMGQPIYKGKGPCYNDSKVLFPQKYFFEHQSATYCSWWKYNNLEVMLMITGHDANTLKFINLAASRVELD